MQQRKRWLEVNRKVEGQSPIAISRRQRSIAARSERKRKVRQSSVSRRGKKSDISWRRGRGLLRQSIKKRSKSIAPGALAAGDIDDDSESSHGKEEFED